MKSIKTIAAAVAAAAFTLGSAHAAPEAAEGGALAPDVIILELQPMLPGDAPAAGGEQDQALLGMLLLQLLAAMQAQGDTLELQVIEPPQGLRI